MTDSGGIVGISDSCGTPSKSQLLCKDHDTERCGLGNRVAVASLERMAPDTAEDGGDAVSPNVSPISMMENARDMARGLTGDDDGDRGSICVDDGSLNTPKGSAFNPFAADERSATRVPHSKKLLDEISGHVAQRLNFGCPVVDIEDGTVATDEDIVDCVYKDLLEAIALLQAEEIVACISCPAGMVISGCQTPTLLPLLNGIADTCPGAPVKRSMKSRVIDWGLRRKLEF